MDILLPALILVVIGIVGLIVLSVTPPPPPKVPAPVKCPTCTEGRTLKDILCPNCGNKTLKPSKPAGSFECEKCRIIAQKLACPKCNTDLIKLLLE